MNFARAIALPSSLALFQFFGCSDPPAPPAQGAVTVAVSGNGACSQSPISAPPDPAGQANLVSGALGCSLENGDSCKPDRYVVVQGDQNAGVSCTVAPDADGYNISLSLYQSAAQNIRFSANGHISATGGALPVYESDANGHFRDDKACVISIVPNIGTIKKGAIWASFNCTNFYDKSDPTGVDHPCTATGIFIFENCNGG